MNSGWFKKGHVPWIKGKKGLLKYERKSKSRASWASSNWKKLVKERDGNKCVQCGSTKYIAAHHIKPWKEFEELRFEITNGMTLCASCHMKLENRVRPKEVKEKISKTLTGRPSWNKGKKLTEAHKEKLRKAKTGCVPWNKGKAANPENIRKMLEARKNLPGPNKGKKMSEETKQKIKETKRKNNANRSK